MQDHKNQVRELSDAELDAVAAGGRHGGAAAEALDRASVASSGASDVARDKTSETPADGVLNPVPE
jgi:hypothetical protein